MEDTLEARAIQASRRNGRGWAFSQRDLVRLGSRAGIDEALQRLECAGRIRHVARGLYDCPRQTRLLGRELSPDLEQVARALARKFGWRIQPSGPAAQDIIGLSTQVPARTVYLSDGPGRSYQIGTTTLVFKHIALKESGFKYWESAVIVGGLKSLGKDRITPEVIGSIRAWLDRGTWRKIQVDTERATGWVYAAIRRGFCEDSDGSRIDAAGRHRKLAVGRRVGLPRRPRTQAPADQKTC